MLRTCRLQVRHHNARMDAWDAAGYSMLHAMFQRTMGQAPVHKCECRKCVNTARSYAMAA
eukprot:2385436-Pleurochrysis_carterae.AAC.10